MGAASPSKICSLSKILSVQINSNLTKDTKTETDEFIVTYRQATFPCRENIWGLLVFWTTIITVPTATESHI